MDTLRRSRSTNDISSSTVTTTTFNIPPLPRPSTYNGVNSAAPDNHSPFVTETQPYVPVGRIRRIIAFFGYGSPTLRARKALVSLYASLIFYTVQFVTIIVVLIIAAKTKSPLNPTVNEWRACTKPLGIWSVLWVVRTNFAATLAYWEWRRSLRTPAQGNNTRRSRRTNHVNDVEPMGLPPRASTEQTLTSILADRASSAPTAPESRLFSRLSVLLSLFTLAWFLTAHIFEYTAIDTCRYSAPHLFWAVFGILCILYFMVLEVVVLGFTVFIIAPLLFLFWNLLLFMLGRHPLQNPDIKPEIGKLPKAIVDRIPLVIYIPPPPEDSNDATYKPEEGTTELPTYPPKTLTTTSTTKASSFKSKRRFKFLRSNRNRKSESSPPKGDTVETDVEQGKSTWESKWEASEYPFVRLDGHRAVCSICLMDFEEPARVDKADSKESAVASGSSEQQKPTVTESSGVVEEIPVESMTEAEHEAELRLADAGEGSQPLRLLACGHAFHKTCIDPWLTDVSGRCAVCQRPVEITPEAPKKKPWRWRRQQ